MSRMATSIVVLAAAMGSPVFAADWGESPEDIYREAYSIEPKDWNEMGDESDGLHIETGLRYWYSWGSESFNLGGLSFEQSDTAHTVEAHLRIDDDITRTYVKGWAGYSAAIMGDYTDPYSAGGVSDGEIGYIGADFGWNALGDGKGTGVGGFIGYNYWNNSPRTSRTNFTTAESASDIAYDPDTGIWGMPGDSIDDKLELHMLRLGLSGKAEINEFFDISAEVAAVPFATITGVQGGHAGSGDDVTGVYPGCALGDPCPTYTFKGSETTIDGFGYGGMAEIMAGFKPMENLTVRLGGRAWYVQGTYDASWREVTVIPPVEQPPEGDPPEPPDPLYSAPDMSVTNWITTENPFSMLRYGLLAEITYSF